MQNLDLSMYTSFYEPFNRLFQLGQKNEAITSSSFRNCYEKRKTFSLQITQWRECKSLEVEVALLNEI